MPLDRSWPARWLALSGWMPGRVPGQVPSCATRARIALDARRGFLTSAFCNCGRWRRRQLRRPSPPGTASTRRPALRTGPDWKDCLSGKSIPRRCLSSPPRSPWSLPSLAEKDTADSCLSLRQPTEKLCPQQGGWKAAGPLELQKPNVENTKRWWDVLSFRAGRKTGGGRKGPPRKNPTSKTGKAPVTT